jgi:hypothetical protein
MSGGGPSSGPTLAFVSGFLGSGKTTAIVGLCRLLGARGVRTAIVTNDQGRHQVDLAFARAAGVPAVAVSDGCLCCRFDDFEERVRELAVAARPQAVFAEAVGSCTDLVATVARPFEAYRERHGAEAGHLSTFVDVRLLGPYLAGRRLPFADHVLYIFERQLAEADVIVLNQRDRVAPERAQAVLEATRERWPRTPALLASAFDEGDLLAWYDLITSARSRPRADVEVDYARYTEGELALAWVDRTLRLCDPLGADLAATVVALLEATARRLRAAGLAVGHLKAHARGEAGEAKLGLVAGDVAEAAEGEAIVAAFYGVAESGAEHDRVSLQTPEGAAGDSVPRLGSTVELLVNLRAVGDPDAVAACLDAAVAELLSRVAVTVDTVEGAAFRPGVPRPRHRLTGPGRGPR